MFAHQRSCPKSLPTDLTNVRQKDAEQCFNHESPPPKQKRCRFLPSSRGGRRPVAAGAAGTLEGTTADWESLLVHCIRRRVREKGTLGTSMCDDESQAGCSRDLHSTQAAVFDEMKGDSMRRLRDRKRLLSQRMLRFQTWAFPPGEEKLAKEAQSPPAPKPP